MKTKTFRFLYGEMNGSLVHFGEVRDTKTEEHFTFLYLKNHCEQEEKNADTKLLFSCPDKIDAVIIGQENQVTAKMLSRILEGSSVGTLIVSEDSEFANEEREMNVAFANRVIRVSSDSEKTENGCDRSCFQMTMAGWELKVQSYGENYLTVYHGPAAGNEKEIYNDCVMGVKAVNGGKPCVGNPTPDGYGCALGCALRQDYDVCKYQRNANEFPYVAGTLLLPDALGVAREQLERDFGDKMKTIRFWGISENKDALYLGLSEDADPNYKRYYIGLECGVKDAVAAELSRRGLNRVPVLLKDGQAVCCSGLLKYAEA